MKLYQICEIYCDYENYYLIVSDKNSDEVEKEIRDNDKEGYLFHVSAREINQIDGYKVILKKII